MFQDMWKSANLQISYIIDLLQMEVNILKTVLVAFNARFSHSSLALRYIKAYNTQKDIEIAEFSINDHIHHSYSTLLKKDADMYCFSVYIWNLEIALKVAQMLKKAKPNVVITFGGPECSYCPEEIFQNYLSATSAVSSERCGQHAPQVLIQGTM